MRDILPSGSLGRSPVIFDGVWQNDGDAQRDGWYGEVWFPHRKHANMAFHDGHTENVRHEDVTSWDPVQVVER